MMVTYAGWLLLFATFSVLQLLLRKQRLPNPTQKVMLIGIVATAFTMMLASFGQNHEPLELFLTPLLLLLQPLVVLSVWALLKPLDMFLKKRILTRATHLRHTHSRLTVIGITGSVGKTTVKELLAHILKGKGALATPVHVNTEMGVAAWLTATLKEKPNDGLGVLIVERYGNG